MAGLLGFTLADLSGAVDSRKRQYANLVRGLLSDPGATLAQLAAVDAEAARGNRYTQMSAGSVMPEVAQQGQEAMLNAAMNVGGLLGMTAYHGSPHTFDKFDMSKIGTGEGRQQQGAGLYFAEEKAVAQKYADKEAAKRGMDKGNVYAVDIPDSVLPKMIRYDDALDAQPNIVKKVVEPMLTPEVRKHIANYYGWDEAAKAPMAAVLDALESSFGSKAAAADRLRAAGIPGIRYLDAGSRGKGGTSNFVLFDDKLPKILSRE